jgi:iron(III) transport system substrate-binding protein
MSKFLAKLFLSCAIAAAFMIEGGWQTAAAQDAWKAEWDKTVAAAKHEGKLVLYMRRYAGVAKAFEKEFPKIKTVVVLGRGSTVGTRIVSERRAGKYLADIYVGGPYTAASILIPAQAVDPIPPALILPEVKDQSKWVTGKHRYTDATGEYNFAFLAVPGIQQISYNSKLVDPKTITSYHDFLDPKWKGKIVSLDPTQRFIGATTQFMYFNPHLGPSYLQEFFGGPNVTFARDGRQMTDWLASGKYAICVGCLYVEKAHKQGLPVGVFNTVGFKEGASFQAASGSISLINKAPDPNAAKVFLNWLLSQQGQIEIQKIPDNGVHFNSGRIDIPKDDVDPDLRLIKGVEYFDQNNPAWGDIPKVVKFAKKVMAESGKE